MTLNQGYVAITTKNLETFGRNPQVPSEVRENITRFCNKANEVANNSRKYEIEEVPEGAL